MDRDVRRQVLTIVAVVATIIVNGMANALPLNGQRTGEISDRFTVFFVPAGYVFAIWGLIYLGLIAFAIYQALPAQRENPRLRRIGFWFVFSCVANSAWLFLWHYELFVLTIVVMLALLLALSVIYWRLEIGRSQVSPRETWCVCYVFSVYLGWISVATIANATAVLDYLSWNGWGISAEIWAVVMLVIAAGLAAAMQFRHRDSAYQAVLVWAFVGIALKQAAAPLVALAAWTMAGVVVLIIIAGTLFQWRRQR